MEGTGEHDRRVGERRLGSAAACLHEGGARDQLLDVDARGRGGKEAERRERGESPVQTGGDDHVTEPLVVDDLAQRAALGVGGDDQPLLVVERTELAQQPVADDQEERHRLRRVARPADDVEQRALEIEGFQERVDRRGVDRIRDHQANARGALRVERLGEEPGAERRRWGSDDDDRVDLGADGGGGLQQAAQVVAASAGQQEGQRPLGSAGAERGAHGREAGRQLPEFVGGEAGCPFGRRDEAVQVHADLHGVPPATAAVARHRGRGSIVGGHWNQAGVRLPLRWAAPPAALWSLTVGLSKLAADLSALRTLLAVRRQSGARVVFTNGCFDLIHPGHVRYLEAARALRRRPRRRAERRRLGPTAEGPGPTDPVRAGARRGPRRARGRRPRRRLRRGHATRADRGAATRRPGEGRRLEARGHRRTDRGGVLGRAGRADRPRSRASRPPSCCAASASAGA